MLSLVVVVVVVVVVAMAMATGQSQAAASWSLDALVGIITHEPPDGADLAIPGVGGSAPVRCARRFPGATCAPGKGWSPRHRRVNVVPGTPPSMRRSRDRAHC